MNKTSIKDFALNSAPVEWEWAVENWKSGPGKGHFPPQDQRPTMNEAIQELDGMIQGLTRLRGYIDARYGHGCGDQGHADGVKQSNRLVAKVRKALGFTQAKHDISF